MPLRPEPDLAGFREAAVTLVTKLGTDVPFFTPMAESYPPGTPLDPESLRPFDPTIQPLASGFGSAVVRCGMAIRPIGLSRRGIADDEISNAIGDLKEGEGVLIVMEGDFEANALDLATECEAYGERWEITQVSEDGLGNVVHRRLVYIKQL